MALLSFEGNNNLNLVFLRGKFKEILSNINKKFSSDPIDHSGMVNKNRELLSNFLIYNLLTKINKTIRELIIVKPNNNFNVFKFINFIELEHLSEFNTIDNELKNYFIENLEEVFREIPLNSTIGVIVELLSIINEELSTKNKVGAFFTPNLLSNYLVEQIIHYNIRNKEFDPNNLNQLFETVTILDPAIGSGNFIISILNYLNNIISSFISDENENYVERIISKYIKFVNNNVFGYDIEIISITITKIRIILTCLDLFISNKQLHRFIGNINNLNISNIIQNDILRNISDGSNLFSLIVGNPPWGISLTHSEHLVKENFTVSKNQFDSWALFLEYGIKNLKTNGFIGFIIPRTLLVNPNFKLIRELVLNITIIKEIINLEEFFFQKVNQPAILIILEKKEKKLKDFPQKTKIIKKLENINKQMLYREDRSFWNKQNSFYENISDYWKKNELFEFNLLNKQELELIQLIENQKIRLYDLVNNGRGVEIGKKGRTTVCSGCGFYLPPVNSSNSSKKCPNCLEIIIKGKNEQKIILNDRKEFQNTENVKEIFLGEHINRYYTKKPHYIIKNVIGINYKKETLYSGPKILIAKTGHGINAYVDVNDTYTLQVVYILKIKPNMSKNYSIWSILGILNSAVIYTYYYTKYGDLNKKSFPHLIQSNILRLPFPKYNENNAHLIEKIGKTAYSLQKRQEALFEMKKLMEELHNNNEVLKMKKLFSLDQNQLPDEKNCMIYHEEVDKNQFFNSNIDFDIENSSSLILGFYFLNKFNKIIKINLKKEIYLLYIYIHLQNQKSRLKHKHKPNLVDFIKNIEIPIFEQETLDYFQMKLRTFYKKSRYQTITELTEGFSKIIKEELLINQYVIDLYNLNELKNLQFLGYPG